MEGRRLFSQQVMLLKLEYFFADDYYPHQSFSKKIDTNANNYYTHLLPRAIGKNILHPANSTPPNLYKFAKD